MDLDDPVAEPASQPERRRGLGARLLVPVAVHQDLGAFHGDPGPGVQIRETHRGLAGPGDGGEGPLGESGHQLVPGEACGDGRVPRRRGHRIQQAEGLLGADVGGSAAAVRAVVGQPQEQVDAVQPGDGLRVGHAVPQLQREAGVSGRLDQGAQRARAGAGGDGGGEGASRLTCEVPVHRQLPGDRVLRHELRPVADRACDAGVRARPLPGQECAQHGLAQQLVPERQLCAHRHEHAGVDRRPQVVDEGGRVGVEGGGQ
jgi:hypothetical protein